MGSGGVFSLEVLDRRTGSVTVRVSGKGSEKIFEEESGGHRWQRVPPNEKRGRVHTSTITVAVLPEISVSDLPIDDRDLEWTACRGSGAGGQHRNVTASAVTVRHVPSGLSVRCESERSQYQNKQTALALLRSRLWELRRSSLARERDESRSRQVGSGMRGDKRRTIRQQDGVVKDHLTGRTWRYEDYVRGKW